MSFLSFKDVWPATSIGCDRRGLPMAPLQLQPTRSHGRYDALTDAEVEQQRLVATATIRSLIDNRQKQRHCPHAIGTFTAG